MKYPVIVWGTGFVGKRVIRELVDHPVFELVGVIVSDPAKEGRDAGEIAGIGPIGVTATRDAAAVLGRGAAAVAYFGPTAAYAAQNIANMSLALRAGVNVVSTAMTPLVYPPACSEDLTRELAAACAEGATSCFTTGIDPGFANDLFPMTLMGLTGRVDSVRIQEILDYSTYTGDYSPMGLGEPVETQALLEIPELLIFGWGHTIPMIADAIGVKLEKIDTIWEKWATPEPIVFPHGRVETGHTAAVRFEIRGWADGEPRIVVEHCNRITHAAAPDWPRPKMVDNDAYRVTIKGSPNIEQETAFRAFDSGDPNEAGCLANGMRAVNAIPAVVDAAPGLLSALDLPLVPGFGAMRAAAGR
ncbi:dihydrodipicolinate reductase [Frankia sp. CNm7]|uniref:Dihydrodipicolinate reductase n=1 Tax=Frankia nepalensis TaxID=1836974 RepID=A0A937RDE5_9ACTN|nr:dihydrodipicolinate reductase [Frankia nepalensis]MBL7500793.1 dihydrodipicolinate reductase [Frankia nepalensis]MBL7512600.1 dihydrodipicolinate reductase [Frankia nepalensis]MBL7523040.1 dihydrodipicolinate reductase [Frankia nepalensis]MBL7628207.1 dihydrodipicolinate reductase [Frankia nepalensis]